MQLLWFIATHGDGRYLGTNYGGRPGDGLFLAHDDRYEITDEFLVVWRALLSSTQEINFAGKHLRVEGARNLFRAIQQPYPRIVE